MFTRSSSAASNRQATEPLPQIVEVQTNPSRASREQAGDWTAPLRTNSRTSRPPSTSVPGGIGNIVETSREEPTSSNEQSTSPTIRVIEIANNSPPPGIEQREPGTIVSPRAMRIIRPMGTAQFGQRDATPGPSMPPTGRIPPPASLAPRQPLVMPNLDNIFPRSTPVPSTPGIVPVMSVVSRSQSVASVPSTFESQRSVETISKDERLRREIMIENTDGQAVQTLERIFNTLQVQYQQENAVQALRIEGLERRWDLQQQENNNMMQRIERIASRTKDGVNTFYERLQNVDRAQQRVEQIFERSVENFEHINQQLVAQNQLITQNLQNQVGRINRIEETIGRLAKGMRNITVTLGQIDEEMVEGFQDQTNRLREIRTGGQETFDLLEQIGADAQVESDHWREESRRTSIEVPNPREPPPHRRNISPQGRRSPSFEVQGQSGYQIRDEGRTFIIQTGQGGNGNGSGPRIKMLKAFEGTRGTAAETFLARMKAFFRLNPNQYDTEERRIVATLMNMAEGPAGNWAQPVLNRHNDNENHPWLDSWEAFQNAYKKQWSDPSKKIQAEQGIQRLHQNKSVGEYVSEFRLLAQELNWNDSALIARFRQGLNRLIKAELFREELRDRMGAEQRNLEGWIDIALQAEEIQKLTNPQNKGKKEDKAEGSKSTPRKVQGDLVPKTEKKRRLDNNLCIKCGEAGHAIADCKKEWTYKDKGKTPVKGKAGEVKEGETEETKSTDSESEN